MGGCGVASKQQSLDCGIVDCQHLLEGVNGAEGGKGREWQGS